MNQLFDRHYSKPYQVRKSKIQVELEEFLMSINGDIMTCTPYEICLFLAWCDRKGKTAVHERSCKSIGDRKPNCMCLKRLAFGTVAAKISQLRSVFDTLGKNKTGGVNDRNPLDSREVRIYLNQIKEEQSMARVTPLQAKPIFVTKLKLIAYYIERKLSEEGIDGSDKFLLARDQAAFKLMFFGGDRAHDLGLMLTQEIRQLPEKAGYIIKRTWGKTHRLNKPNVYSIFRSDDDIICPVRGLECYMAVANSLKIDLSTGYLFRTMKQVVVRDEPLSYEAIYQRLKRYLHALGIYESETPHSFRAGCAIVLGSSGKVSIPNWMDHIGWSAESTAKHYARSSKMEQASRMSKCLSEGIATSAVWKGSVLGYLDESTLPKMFTG